MFDPAPWAEQAGRGERLDPPVVQHNFGVSVHGSLSPHEKLCRPMHALREYYRTFHNRIKRGHFSNDETFGR